MALKNKTIVKIGGKEYTLMGVETEEYLKRIALYIDKRISEITRMNHMLSTSEASVLTAVNVADDYFKSRQNEVKLNTQLKEVMSEIERLKEETKKLKAENAFLEDRYSTLQIELDKRELELNEFRSSTDVSSRQKIYIAR